MAKETVTKEDEDHDPRLRVVRGKRKPRRAGFRYLGVELVELSLRAEFLADQGPVFFFSAVHILFEIALATHLLNDRGLLSFLLPTADKLLIGFCFTFLGGNSHGVS